MQRCTASRSVSVGRPRVALQQQPRRTQRPQCTRSQHLVVAAAGQDAEQPEQPSSSGSAPEWQQQAASVLLAAAPLPLALCLDGGSGGGARSGGGGGGGGGGGAPNEVFAIAEGSEGEFGGGWQPRKACSTHAAAN